jgi:selenocysteine-specific elongation factor
MKHIIVGTAGHIDHGKTTLIKALTGRNTDRWEEEQRRGITIDLGFTYFDLPNQTRVGIIDVPGHEKFINNMVAGVVGMDLVMLVVAADEGIMPQTREHMDILGMLGVKKSILVLNKCDLVDREWLDLVEEDIREELKGTFLEDAPVAEVSAVTGQGIPELTALIQELTEGEVTERDTETIPRLPVDRVFSLSGFGTIITGTLISGKIRKEDTLQIYPLGKECRIRSIQVHGRDEDCCYAGQRVALNLSNVRKSEISRGCVLAPPDSMKNTRLLDVRLDILPSSLRVLGNQTRLHLFSGTSEILCRAYLLNAESLGPGESCYAQLRLEEEAAFSRGDRFVVRFYSPMETIGGGVVLDANPQRKKRFRPEVVEELERKESGSTGDVLELQIRNHSETMITVTELAKVTARTREEVLEDIHILESDGVIHVYPMKKDSFLWHSADEYCYRTKIEEQIREYHDKYPYRYGMKKAEIHSICMKKVKLNAFDLYIEELVQKGCLRRHGEFLCMPEFEVRKDAIYQKVKERAVETYRKAGYDFVRVSEIDFGDVSKETQEDIYLLLQDEGIIVKVYDQMYSLTEYMEKAKDKVLQKLSGNPIITIAEVRDIFQTSRKSAKPILEYMDSIKVTKKTGAESERASYL